MSVPDHIAHQGSSRHWAYKQQSQQDLPHPVLPTQFSLDRTYSFEKESPRRSSAAQKYGTRSRNNSRVPRTLTDAFEATSRTVAMNSNEGVHVEHTAIPDRTPSPHRRRQRNASLHSPLAEVTSPPPGELLETYQRITDADDLADLVSEDDLGITEDNLSRRSSRERRRRRESPESLNLRHTLEDGDNNLGPVFSYLDDVTDDYARGKLSTYKRDEERLNHVTTSQSPVFSKAKVGSKADGLQRRESDPQTEQTQDLADEDGIHLGLNVPKSWGNKAKSHRQWLSSLTDTPRGEVSGRERRTRVESRSRSPRLTAKSPSGDSHEYRDGREQKSERSRLGGPPSDGLHNNSRARSRSIGTRGITGDTIPNTPITIYKSSSRDRAQKTRSDSRDLLRKLARTESPNQHNTPEQQKQVETSLPQKTPVVIGAWVDTPMTVGNTDTNEEDDTKEIDSPSKTAPKSTGTPALHSSDSQNRFKRESLDMTTMTEVKAQNVSTKPDAPSRKSVNLDSEKQPHRGLVKPELPKSALEDVIKEAKSKTNPMLELGDDTINSLQGIMDNTNKRSSRFMAIDEEKWKKELDAIESDIDQHQTNDKPRQQLDQMSSKIQSIIHSIHDARMGLDVIEDTIASGNKQPGLAAAEGRVKRCKTCGTAQENHGNERIYLAIPIPRLWTRDRRPTYLGWAIVIFGLWYISESTMCDYYCHPTIAEVCDGYCLHPDAPQFPFTLPTMLWRWSHLSDILSPLITIFIALFRLVAQLLGIWDGYVADDNNLSDFQWWSPSSSSSSGDIPVGSSEYKTRNALFGLWSDKTSTLTSSSNMPTILQKVIEDQDPQGGIGVGVDDSMDGDEIL